MPRVSVIIATFNRSRFIRESIESVLSQTFNDYELIVVDDGSTDNTRAIVAGYGGRIRYFYKDHANQSAALNFGISQAEGEYIAFLDDDDLWLPEKLEKQMRIIDADRSVGLVAGEIYQVDVEGKITYHWGRRYSNPVTFKFLFDYNVVNHSAALARKSLIVQAGGFDETLLTTQDYDLWLRVSKLCKVHYINEPLAKIRIHPGNKRNNRIQKLKDRIRVISKDENMRGLGFWARRRRIAKEYYIHAGYFRDLGFPRLAGVTYFQSVVTFPFIGIDFTPETAGAMVSFWLYRLLRPYIQAFYWWVKGIASREDYAQLDQLG